ncbi:MAG: DUF4870 domain-containing protein [Chloroflexi bacterium]|nr:DUF4870 domain-containing protein [Chloroflexota bacterium]
MDELKRPTQDERIMAALSHGAIVLPTWGIILATIVWLTQREKSEYVRRQAIQAVAWQVAQIGALFLGMACYMSTVFLIIGAVIAMDGSPSGEPPAAIFLPFSAMGLVFLAMFVFIVFGIVAAVRVLQGATFRYPVVGGLVEKYLDGQ